MSAIDLFTHPGQKNVDPRRQKALLIAWLLLSSNSLLSYPQTRIFNSDDELKKVKQDGNRTANPINYIDLRDVYPRLAPLTPAEVDQIFALARRMSEFGAISSAYWSEGESMLNYSDHYCLAVQDVLAMNS